MSTDRSIREWVEIANGDNLPEFIANMPKQYQNPYYQGAFDFVRDNDGWWSVRWR
jgi:hypothetical protein